MYHDRLGDGRRPAFCVDLLSATPISRAFRQSHRRSRQTRIDHASTRHNPTVLDNAIAIGTEWLGVDSPVLACLRLGVAIHHGALPTPYRKEVERLLRDGILRVTASSPTLAQGLNPSATTLIFHGLKRGSEPIDISEFRNVVGRAGRAYVDVEGLVLMPMFDRLTNRRAEWKDMVDSAKGKEMESGLRRVSRNRGPVPRNGRCAERNHPC